MVVIVFGLPGSGKSYFASSLAKKIAAVYINSDQVRLNMNVRKTYSEEEKNAVYQKMLDDAVNAVSRKQNVVLDGTFYKSALRNFFADGLKNRAALFFIEVWAEESVIRERVAKPRAFSDADFEVYKKIKSMWQPLEEKHLLLKSTNSNLEQMITDAIGYIKLK